MSLCRAARTGTVVPLLAQGVRSQAPKTTVTAVRCAGGKYPVQEWGWGYLLRQRSLGRPISPHLTVYKQPMWTWTVSGGHRILGCAMGVGALVVAGGVVALPFTFTDLIDYIKSWNLPFVIKEPIKFLVAWMIIFHSVNGVRFIGYDMARLLNSGTASIVRGSQLVLATSTLLAFFVVFVAPYLWDSGAKA